MLKGIHESVPISGELIDASHQKSSINPYFIVKKLYFEISLFYTLFRKNLKSASEDKNFPYSEDHPSAWELSHTTF